MSSPGEINTSLADPWESPARVRTLVLLAATAGFCVLCYLLAAPFIAPLVLAMALAVMFAPLHRRLESRLKRPNLAAVVTISLVVLIAVLPLTLITGRLFAEASDAATTIKAKVESGEWSRTIEANPRIVPIARWIEENTDLPGTIATAASWLTAKGAMFVRGSVIQLVGFLVTIYLLFFFLRDRRAMLDAWRAHSPLPVSTTDRLGARVADTIHATVYGTLVIAVAKGTLGGLMFWWLGLPAALLWGVVMGLLAVVPIFGAFLVWIPVTLFLATEGSWGKATVLAIWGTVMIGGIDNVLYPILIGNRLKMHTVLVFISVIGGLMAFGPIGLILGPVVVTITMFLLELWRSRDTGG